ncbi:unnamed protein product [Didymodactylos carnosus]|uniref:EGF-like domain-containing protein n=1 Tax=Didymodactylos carnosus TaxID=1234261 RepID=A0A813UQE6_9BILA|nr:unnamed protein product [Didymodactylos carnosus]CAF0826569.1 unnamed protein product [Didymodactylos carnosus]CAF3498256.1 unnamed protein product [Didymodactylos carnosus]CAF3613411.1 unnamed protein product [Didymodactylos carnosus]
MLCTIFLITAALLVHITGQQQTNKSGLCNNMTCAYGKCEQMECKCDPGITGKQCDIDIKDCEQEACLNGGTCIELVNGFSCQCSQWYYGFRCQYAISLIHFPCLSYKCLNGGTCVMVNDEPKCLCNNQYDGLKCEHYLNQPKSCNVLQCYNGGTCIAVGMPPLFDLYCLCKKNHQGAKCELNATPYSGKG